MEIVMIKFDLLELVEDGWYLFKTNASPKGFTYLEAYLKQVNGRMVTDIHNQAILERSVNKLK